MLDTSQWAWTFHPLSLGLQLLYAAFMDPILKDNGNLLAYNHNHHTLSRINILNRKPQPISCNWCKKPNIPPHNEIITHEASRDIKKTKLVTQNTSTHTKYTFPWSSIWGICDLIQQTFIQSPNYWEQGSFSILAPRPSNPTSSWKSKVERLVKATRGSITSNIWTASS